jgi:hypothetical protein
MNEYCNLKNVCKYFNEMTIDCYRGNTKCLKTKCFLMSIYQICDKSTYKILKNSYDKLVFDKHTKIFLSILSIMFITQNCLGFLNVL